MKKFVLIAALATGILSGQAKAQDTIKIGFIAPTTGQFSQIGNLMIAGAKYYIREHGTNVAGDKRSGEGRGKVMDKAASDDRIGLPL